MTHFFKCCQEWYGFFAAIEKGHKFCFENRCHDVFDDSGENKDRTIAEFFAILFCEVNVCCCSAFPPGSKRYGPSVLSTRILLMAQYWRDAFGYVARLSGSCSLIDSGQLLKAAA